MNIIKTKILLEDFISRSPSMCYPISGWTSNDGPYGNWGRYVYSLDLSKLPESDEFYLLSTYKVQTFKSLMNRYFAIKKFYDDTKYYKYRKVNTTSTWYELDGIEYDQLISGVTYYVYQPDTFDDFTNNDIIGVNNSANEYNLKIIDGNDINLLFFKFVEKTLGIIRVPESIDGRLVPYKIYACDVSGYYDKLIGYKISDICCEKKLYGDMGGEDMEFFLYSKRTLYDETKTYLEGLVETEGEGGEIKKKIPVIPMNIIITNTIDDIGIYTPIIKNWNSGERYYIGDKVIYENKTYQLFMNDSGSTIPSGDTVGFVGFQNTKSLTVEFDVVDINGNYIHWNLIEHSSDYNIGTTISSNTESRLFELVRKQKNSVDDHNNELPGILIPNSGETDGYEAYLDMQFSAGIMYNKSNLPINENETLVIGDTISGITLTVYDINVSFNQLMSMSVGTTGKITFTYYMGLRHIYSGNTLTSIDTTKAIKHTETYTFTLGEIEVYLDKDGVIIGNIKKYVNVDYDGAKDYYLNSNFDISTKNMINSNITYKSNQIYNVSDITLEPLIMDSNIIKNDYLFGISSDPIIKGDIFIDRGTNAAIEKHLKLIEVKTLQDLENYGNGFFNVK